jgi:Tfp pilus assembly PilM family ATPase
MGIGMFSAQTSPIAIDFGSSSVKLLQIGAGDRPALIGATEIPIPDSIRGENERLMAFYAEWLPKIMRDATFKGKRAVMALPAAQTFIQHMQIADAPGVNRDSLIKAQLQAQTRCAPGSVVVRSMEVCPVHRNGQSRTEMICFAIARETVMKYVELLKKCKLEVVGVHTDTLAMVRAFDHITRRDQDINITTLYVDLGWGGTRVAITHGRQLMFARYISIGGKHFDQLIANTVHCDVPSARVHRLAQPGSLLQSSAAKRPAATFNEGTALLNVATAKAAEAEQQARAESAAQGSSQETTTIAVDRRVGAVPPELAYAVEGRDVPKMAVNVDVSELLDTITDELSMCLRYHQSLFGESGGGAGRPINRAIFVGGEARQAWLCQHIVKELRVPAQMGDPLARFDASQNPPTPGLTLGQPQPGWAVACGLCNAPTDL